MTKIQFSADIPETFDKEGFDALEWTDINDAIVMRTRPAGPIRENELLYDKDGQPVAIKSNGKILPIIEGDL